MMMDMSETNYDVLVLGCGPGGSSVGTFLARAGKRVLILEKEVFPRFHIGESLLPCNMPIFEEMGVMPALREAKFPVKLAAQFQLGNGSVCTRFVFAEGRFNRAPNAIQVERAVLDHILLKNTRASGADVREGWTATKFSEGPDGVSVEARDPSGIMHQFRASYLVDATGRSNLTGNQESLREIHPRWKKLAVFGHFENVALDDGVAWSDTIIVRLENKWFWIIPISETRTSVGIVFDKDEFTKSAGTPRDIFDRWVESTPPVKTRMANARLCGVIQTTSDFSYHNRRLVGSRLLRVGDAAGFMDPIFSAGVYLASWSGKLAAEALLKCLAAGKPSPALFRRYEKRVWRGLRFYWRVVEQYYTTSFMEIFLRPGNHYDLPSAVNAVLAGELEGTWALKWRLEYFFFLVKVQRHFKIVPPIFFGPRRDRKLNPMPRPEKA
jgi:FADH2-dependent halogenase